MFSTKKLLTIDGYENFQKKTQEFAIAVNSLGYGQGGMFMPIRTCPSLSSVNEAFRKRNFSEIVRIITRLWFYGDLHQDIDPNKALEVINLAITSPLSNQKYHHFFDRKMTCQSKLVALRDDVLEELHYRSAIQKVRSGWILK